MAALAIAGTASGATQVGIILSKTWGITTTDVDLLELGLIDPSTDWAHGWTVAHDFGVDAVTVPFEVFDHVPTTGQIWPRGNP